MNSGKARRRTCEHGQKKWRSWREQRKKSHKVAKKAKYPMSDTNDIRDTRKLRIWQQNINQSLEGQLDLLQSLKANNYNIAAIQEPHIDFPGCTQANLHWTVIYPKQHLMNPKKMRSIILIN